MTSTTNNTNNNKKQQKEKKPYVPIEDLSTLLPSGALPVLLLRSVTGEGGPVFPDAATVRREVFTEEQHVSPVLERDAWDVASLHVVAYVHVGATRRYHALHPPPSNNKNSNNSRGHIILTSLPLAEQKLLLAKQEGEKEEDEEVVPVGVSRLRIVDHTKELGKFPGPVAKIERLCVRKDFRKYKVGWLLMTESERIAKEEMKMPLVALHAQTKAKQFYTRRGYVIKTGLFDENGIEHVGMTKLFNEIQNNNNSNNNTNSSNAVGAEGNSNKDEEKKKQEWVCISASGDDAKGLKSKL